MSALTLPPPQDSTEEVAGFPCQGFEHDGSTNGQ